MSLYRFLGAAALVLLLAWSRGAMAAENNTATAHTGADKTVQGDDMEIDSEDTDEGIVADDEPVADEPMEEEGPDESGE